MCSKPVAIGIISAKSKVVARASVRISNTFARKIQVIATISAATEMPAHFFRIKNRASAAISLFFMVQKWDIASIALIKGTLP